MVYKYNLKNSVQLNLSQVPWRLNLEFGTFFSFGHLIGSNWEFYKFVLFYQLIRWKKSFEK